MIVCMIEIYSNVLYRRDSVERKGASVVGVMLKQEGQPLLRLFPIQRMFSLVFRWH
jgi:hypothetical protein